MQYALLAGRRIAAKDGLFEGFQLGIWHQDRGDTPAQERAGQEGWDYKVAFNARKELKIARVFPTRTNMCPTDKDAYFDAPDLFTPQYDEVHISTTFTWDKDKAMRLAMPWYKNAKTVKVGGPAFDDLGNRFIPGKYLKKGVIITSRGCPKKCNFCFVPKREGKIRELPIMPGNIIQDNNLLACSRSHIDKVFAMLKGQKHIDFPGGLDAYYITDKIVEQLRGLSIYQLWLSFDKLGNERALRKAVKKLARYFRRDQIRCYVLIGYNGDSLIKAELRLQKAWEIGTLPFAMRFRTPEPQWQGTYLYGYEKRDWNILQRSWTRPAIIKTRMK